MKTLFFIHLLLLCVCKSHINLRNTHDYSNDYDDEWDWRKHHQISSVDNELISNCSTSYIFAAIGALEGIETIKHNNYKKISSQEYLDCSGSNSCKIGSVTDVFEYYSDKKVCRDDSYTYNGNINECQSNKCSTYLHIKKLSYTMIKGEKTISIYVYVTPVPTKIYIDSLKDYKGGVYKNYDDCNHEPNHWVLIVGYGKEGSDKYWIIKNDYGEEWGENGYLRLERGKGMCGIGKESYALYYSKWERWLIVAIVIVAIIVLVCVICCCCCCTAALTGSTALIFRYCCCCCYCCAARESCVHPERMKINYNDNKYIYNNQQTCGENIVRGEIINPVEGQKVLLQQPIQQQYIPQPYPTTNSLPRVEYNKVNYSINEKSQIERQVSDKNEHILLPSSNPY